ncbi:peroxidase 12-like [Amaranthus tricolor]|uniref:peroxidase 12-like n=1 Tax=Amaranthus tricolor TaxID=29722 RepID=UPI00258D7CBE|nr:peroxidase 12-like [Amaranthus tricolor]
MGSKLVLLLIVIWCSLLSGFSKGDSKISVPVAPGLSYNFYASSCPNLEFIVRNHLIQVFQTDITQAAGLLRLHFHDCFVLGCDASVLLDGSASGPSEQNAPPNLSLRKQAFKIINDLRALVHNACGRVVSCADITALAARDSVVLSGGPNYYIPLGRRDSLNFATQNETLANLPSPKSNADTILDSLSKKKLDPTDVVALSGGHTIGISHCASFGDRLYPTQDSTMDQTFAKNLKVTCPKKDTDNTTVLDIRSPNVFDNKYYVDLMNRQGLFTSDQDLYTNSKTKEIVKSFAVNQSLFFDKFVVAMLKMGQLGVLTSNQGEIRANCSARNTNKVDLWSIVDEQGNQPGSSAQF